MAKNPWEVFVGRTWFGVPVHYNLKGTAPHICIAGATGSGKSEFLKLLLYLVCQKQSANNIEIEIVDLKMGATFAAWLHAPQVRAVHDTTEEAFECLLRTYDEMRKRLDLIKLARYNFQPEPRFKELFVVFDEGGEMSPNEADGDEKKLRTECMQLLSSLVRIGREPGVHIIYTTQRPDNDTLPTRIRSQLETRFCFHVKENLDSQIVLRHTGAEDLPLIPGRMIMQTPFKEQQVQAAYVPPEVVTRWLKSCRTHVPKPSQEPPMQAPNIPSSSTVTDDSLSTVDFTDVLGDF